METVDEANQIKIRGPRMTFDFLFFFIVPTLLLSILSGIIIDNFGERRSHSDTINEKKGQKCFICGEASSDIPNFTNHSKYEHNLWDYMYYIGYLRSLEEAEMEDFRDIYVNNCIEKKDHSWFPSNRKEPEQQPRKSEQEHEYLRQEGLARSEGLNESCTHELKGHNNEEIEQLREQFKDMSTQIQNLKTGNAKFHEEIRSSLSKILMQTSS